MDAPIIILGGVRAELQAPRPLLALALARAPEQIEAMEGAELWALASLALLETWPRDVTWPAPLRPRLWRCGERVADRGQEVYDGLIAAGVPWTALLGSPSEPGILSVAHAWAQSHLLSAEVVDRTRDFCVVRPAKSPDSNSGSAVGTDSPPSGGAA